MEEYIEKCLKSPTLPNLLRKLQDEAENSRTSVESLKAGLVAKSGVNFLWLRTALDDIDRKQWLSFSLRGDTVLGDMEEIYGMTLGEQLLKSESQFLAVSRPILEVAPRILCLPTTVVL